VRAMLRAWLGGLDFSFVLQGRGVSSPFFGFYFYFYFPPFFNGVWMLVW
jgi:hypothetical protein